MNLVVLTFTISILLPLCAFFFFRKQLEKNPLWFIIGGGVIAMIGIYIYITSIEEKKYFYLGMLVPLYSTLLYKGLTYLFIQQFGRMPVDTFFAHEGNIWDRLFNIGYAFLITVVPMFTILYLGEATRAVS